MLRSHASDTASMREVCDNDRMQAIDALLERRSARALTEPGPDDGTLGLMLTAATRAPDHGRLRPWRFVVIRGAARARLGELLAGHLQRAQPNASAEALERERLKSQRAPVIVVVAAHCHAAAKIPMIEQTLSAGAAAYAVMLAAPALGFGAMWKTGDASYDPVVREGLGLGPEDSIVGFLYLGTEAGEPVVAGARPDWQSFTRELAPHP